MSSAAIVLAPLSEAATVQFLPEFPENNVFLRTDGLGSAGSAIGYTSSANRWAGFSFSPENDVSLSQISIYVSSRSDGLSSKVLSVQVVSLDSLTATPNLSVPANILASERGTLPIDGLPNGQFAYLTVNLDSPVALQKAGFYGVIVNFVPEEGNTTNGLSLRYASSSSSMRDGVGGSFYTEDAGGTYTTSNASYHIALAAPIPEPGSAALLGMLAPSLLFGYLARRKGRAPNA